MSKIIDYAGIKIDLKGNCGVLVKSIYDFLKEGGCKPSLNSKRDITVTIDFTQDIPAVRKALLAKSELASRGFLRDTYISGDKIMFDSSHDKTMFLFDKSKKTLRGWVSEKWKKREAVFLNVVFMNMLRFALQFYGLYFIHAAGLEKNNRGVLLIAPAGGGKSVNALQLVKSGFKFLSDDQIGIRKNKQNVEIIFSPEWLGLTLFPDARNLFNGLKKNINRAGIVTAPYIKTLKRKIKVPMNRLFAGSVKQSAHPMLMIFMEKTVNAKPSLARISKSEAVAQIMKDNLILFDSNLFPDLSRKHFSLLSALIDQVKTYRLTYSMKQLPQTSLQIKELLCSLS